MYLCIDIFIEHFGNKESIGKTRGIYLTIINIAWVLSPIVTATIITNEGGYKAIYLIALVTMMLTTIALTLSVKNFKDRIYTRTPFLKTYKFLKENRHMMAVTVINFILQFFYAWMVVYTPIYLIEHLGFTWDKIGIIFTIMLVPFVIFGLPVGILIDKYNVKKRTLLYMGFLIIALSTALISFTTSSNLALWALILFTTRTGASIIETTSEIYFFTHVKEEDAYLLGLFRDMAPLAYLVAPLFATMIFYFLPFRYLFIILSAILLSGIYYVKQLKHNHESSLSN
jgi:MFS family permease